MANNRKVWLYSGVALICSCGPAAFAAQADPTAPATAGPAPISVDEIVVTAERSKSTIKDTPVSVSALTGAQLQTAHIQSIDDMTRSTPAISFSAGATGEGAGEGQESIDIRGVSSSVGAPTTGLYWDETPITLPGGMGATQPRVFDMARIEVLRGPQGTLYGASSEGGTIKYVPQMPSFAGASLDLTVIPSYTAHGGANGEGVIVANAPIVADLLALRVGVDVNYQSGWIDRYAHLPGDLSDSTGQLLQRGTNAEQDFATRVSLLYQPTDDLEITPSIFYQRAHFDDQPTSYLNLPAYEQVKNVDEFGTDEFVVGSLKIVKKFANFDVASITSYYWKQFYRAGDGTGYDSYYVTTGILDPALPQFASVADPALSTLPVTALDRQNNNLFVQEIRLSSPESSAHQFLHWVGGFYYSVDGYHLQHVETAPGWSSTFQSVYGFSPNNAALSPIASAAFPTLWSNDYFQTNNTKKTTADYAAYGQLDIRPISKLTLSAGLRYDYFQLGYSRTAAGFFNLGLPSAFTSQAYDSAVTPKFSALYAVSPSTNLYATVANGFRQKGPNDPVPEAICAGDYQALGISPEAAAYKSDSLWNYEGGVKIAKAGLNFSASGYYIKWTNIQQQITLPSCGYAYVSNVGDAELYGAEAELSYRLPFLRGLKIGLVGSLEHTDITRAQAGSPASVGESLLYVPEASMVASADYTYNIDDGRSLYGHVDYDWTGRSHGSFEAGNPDYNDPAYGIVNFSVGYRVERWDISLFAKNLTDDETVIKHPQINTVIEAYRPTPLTAGVRLNLHL